MLISDAFLWHLAVSFAAGALVVAFVTMLADVYGEGPAGFIGGFPSAGPVNLLSIGLTQTTAAAVEATTLFPLGFSGTYAFLLFYAYPSRASFWARMVVALGLWLPIMAAIALLSPDNFEFSVGAGLVIASAVLVLRKRIDTPRGELMSSKPGASLTILRGLLGGSVVTAVVILSEISGPLVGGVFAAAPAIWSSSLYATSRSKGVEFSRTLTWNFMKAGILTVIPYGVAARYFFPTYGVWVGTLFAYVAISPLVYLAWRLTNGKKTRASGGGGT